MIARVLFGAFMVVMVVLLVLLLPATCHADSSVNPNQPGRRYDAKGNFDGTYRKDRSGMYRLYDESGNFEGTIREGREGSYRRYDEDNNYEGSAYSDYSDE